MLTISLCKNVQGCTKLQTRTKISLTKLLKREEPIKLNQQQDVELNKDEIRIDSVHCRLKCHKHDKLSEKFMGNRWHDRNFVPGILYFFNRNFGTDSKCDDGGKKDGGGSAVRHMYHEDCEKVVNEQIVVELNAAYAYLSMAAFFGRTEIALPGCYGYFIKMYEEELEHARIFLEYQNRRGGHVKLCPLAGTECNEWSIQKALEVGLEMEKLVKEKLIKAYDTAEKQHDLDLMDMIVTDFIDEQEKSICEFGRLLMRYNNMKVFGHCGCVDFMMDKEIHSAFVKKASHSSSSKLLDLTMYK